MSVNRKFSEDERLNYVIGYYESGKNCHAYSKTAGISPQLLNKWLEKFSQHPDILSLQERLKEFEMAKQSQPLTEREKELIAELENIKKALELEKMRSRGFEIMVDIAERKFNIPIKKKAGTNV